MGVTELQIAFEWQTALCLFFGSTGAGGYIVAALLYFSDAIMYRKTVRQSLWVSLACTALALTLLTASVLQPFEGLLFWQSSIDRHSWLMVGAGILVGALGIYLTTALLLSEKALYFFAKRGATYAEVLIWISRTVFVLGSVVAMGAVVYPGILLMGARGIPLWHTALVPIILTLSALVSGVAYVGFVAVLNASREKLKNGVLKNLESAIVVLVMLELLFLADYAILMLSGVGLAETDAQLTRQSLSLVIEGAAAPLFWVVIIAGGHLLPLILAIIGIRLKLTHLPLVDDVVKQEEADAIWEQESVKSGTTLYCVGAVGILMGGMYLRLFFLLTGLYGNEAVNAAAEIVKGTVPFIV